MQSACCLGPSVHSILFEGVADRMSVVKRIKWLIDSEKDPKVKEQLEQMSASLKILSKRKHPGRNEIVLRKKTEKVINDLFAAHTKELLKIMNRNGLPQLETFYRSDSGERSLFLWVIDPDGGEQDEQYKLSNVLNFEVEDTGDDDDIISEVFIFYGELAQEMLECHSPVPLATVPSLNVLESEKIRVLRERFAPYREEMEGHLVPAQPGRDGQQYCTGTWDLEGMKAFAPRLQEALDEMPELRWAEKVHTDFRANLHVGNMETPELLKLLYDRNLIPADTWEVLKAKHESGRYCPDMAYMAVTPDAQANAPVNISHEEALTHKRKTIELD